MMWVERFDGDLSGFTRDDPRHPRSIDAFFDGNIDC